MESLRLTTTLPVTPDRVYAAWASADEHSRMTGSPATGEAKKDARFTAWDGYITGTFVLLDPPRRIVQMWRTQEFPSSNPDSKLEIRFARAPRGCRLMLLQSGIPDGQAEQYAEAWEQFYFEPMNAYFASLPKAKRTEPGKKGEKKAPRKKAVVKKKSAPAKRTASKKSAPAKRTASKKKPAPRSKKKAAKKRR
ncbi:MAG TPA: SRPBCC domain-containing protein [Polyangiaceae bacterium]|nr:SRPBCC domain-containing protein [Polyangiaceae bacterium]